jgi:hypothetical protein
MLLNVLGIFFFKLIFPSQKSLKLPLGHKLPQNHLPLKGLISIKAANTNNRK